jgi:hypothetical protein
MPYIETEIVKVTAEASLAHSGVNLIADLSPRGLVVCSIYLEGKDEQLGGHCDASRDCHGLKIPSLQAVIDFYRNNVPEAEQLDKFKEIVNHPPVEAKIIPQPPVYDLAELNRSFSIDNLRKAIECYGKGQPTLIELHHDMVWRLAVKELIHTKGNLQGEIDGIPVTRGWLRKSVYFSDEIYDTNLVYEDGSRLVMRTKEV